MLAVMHRLTLSESGPCQNKVPIYTTCINILVVTSIHHIVRLLINVSIHIDGSLHPYKFIVGFHRLVVAALVFMIGRNYLIPH